MVRTLKAFIKSLPIEEQRAIAARTQELLAEEASLQDLRKAMGKTQVQMAKTLGVGQDAISRVEKRTDMLLSTLGDYVRGMGGELKLIAEFPGRRPVQLAGLGALRSGPVKPVRAAGRRVVARKRKSA